MTYQRPAYEEITIAHGGGTVTLRPSLRAAATLEQRHGIPTLFKALDEGNFTVISEIILSSATTRQDAAAFLSNFVGRPLSLFFAVVTAPLVELVSMLMPAPVQRLDTEPQTGKPAAWSEYYAALFGYATGWLHWTSEAAWNATPTEIDRAFAAHVEMLKAIHGSGETDQSAHDPREEVTQGEVKAGLAQLRANAKRGRA